MWMSKNVSLLFDGRQSRRDFRPVVTLHGHMMFSFLFLYYDFIDSTDENSRSLFYTHVYI